MFERRERRDPNEADLALVRLKQTCHEGHIRCVFTHDGIEIMSAGNTAVERNTLIRLVSERVFEDYPSFYDPRQRDLHSAASLGCAAMSRQNTNSTTGGFSPNKIIENSISADLLNLRLKAVISRSMVNMINMEDCSTAAAVYKSHGLCAAVLANCSHLTPLSAVLPRLIAEDAARIAIRCAREQIKDLGMFSTALAKINYCLAVKCAEVLSTFGLSAQMAEDLFGPLDLGILIADKKDFVVLGRGSTAFKLAGQPLIAIETPNGKFLQAFPSSANRAEVCDLSASMRQSSMESAFTWEQRTQLAPLAFGSAKDLIGKGAALRVGEDKRDGKDLSEKTMQLMRDMMLEGIDPQTLAAMLERENVLAFCHSRMGDSQNCIDDETFLKVLRELVATNASIGKDQILSKRYEDFMQKLRNSSADEIRDLLLNLYYYTKLPYMVLPDKLREGLDKRLLPLLAKHGLGSVFIHGED